MGWNGDCLALTCVPAGLTCRAHARSNAQCPAEISRCHHSQYKADEDIGVKESRLSNTCVKKFEMATVTQVQEATNADGQPIKLAVAYSDEVHDQVRFRTLYQISSHMLHVAQIITNANPGPDEIRNIPTCIRHHD